VANVQRTSLKQIAKQLDALTKRSTKDAVETGRLLQQAFEEHEGHYTTWLKDIGRSERTAMRYRNIFRLKQTNRQFAGSLDRMVIDVSALHLLADPNTPEKARKKIIDTAVRGHVDYYDAVAIVAAIDPPPTPTPVPRPRPRPRPSSTPALPPIEPLDDDDDDGDGDADDSGDEKDDVRDKDDAKDDDEDDDGGAAAALVTALNVVWRSSGQPKVWRKAVKSIGPVKLQGLIDTLKTAYDTHCGKDSVRLAADRAEGRLLKCLSEEFLNHMNHL
jgi:hypothetical protein